MLKDLIVVELASVLAGPAVGMFFAELGAKVIKIENKTTGGDVTRRWRLPQEDKERAYSAYYCSVNYQKETLFLDLKDPIDYGAVLDLIGTADIVISNFKPSSARKLQLDAVNLRAQFPRLIYAELSGYGQHSDQPAFDVVLQAEAGFMHMNGEVEGNAVKMPVALIDILAAHQLKEGILLALLKREQTGKGSIVRTSLYESALASLANQATNWLMNGHIPQRMGSQHPNIAPYGDTFYTADKKALVLAVGTEKQFARLCKVLDKSDLLEDDRFKTNAVRVKNREILAEILAEVINKWQRERLLARLQEVQVPVGSIRNMLEVFAQPEAQQMILEEEMADGSKSRRVKTIAFALEE